MNRYFIVRALVYTHRWLGIAGSLLFVAWFVSGIVMIYAQMPAPQVRTGCYGKRPHFSRTTDMGH